MNSVTTVEIGFLITVVLFALSVWSNIRTARKDTKDEEAEHTTVLIKLENILTAINEMKTDIKSVKADLKDLDGRLIIAEQSLKARWKQIDALNKRSENNGH